MPAFMLLFLLALIFMLPLSVYLIFLGLVNRRDTPWMVAGTWDFVGLIVGLSGFLIGGAAFTLHALNNFLQIAELQLKASALGNLWLWLAAFGYLLALGSILTFTLLLRTASTVIYNVDPTQLEATLCQILTDQGCEWSRAGDCIFVRSKDPRDWDTDEPGGDAQAERVPSELAADSAGVTILELTPSRLFRNMTLHWHQATTLSARTLRQALEKSLAQALTHMAAPENPLASSFLTLGGLLFGMGLFLLALMVYSTMHLSR